MNDDDNLGFGPIDDELRRRLGGRAPATGDPDATLATLTPRFRRARHRHRVLVACGSALALAVVAVVGTVAATGSSGGNSVRVPPTSAPRQDRQVTTTTAPTPTPTTSPQPSATEVPDETVSTAPAPSASVPQAPTTKTYSSAGGSVTVHVENGALSLVSTEAASGFSEERTGTGPARVEVRFTNTTGTEWRIRVDLMDGEPQSEITQHGS